MHGYASGNGEGMAYRVHHYCRFLEAVFAQLEAHFRMPHVDSTTILMYKCTLNSCIRTYTCTSGLACRCVFHNLPYWHSLCFLLQFQPVVSSWLRLIWTLSAITDIGSKWRLRRIWFCIAHNLDILSFLSLSYHIYIYIVIIYVHSSIWIITYHCMAVCIIITAWEWEISVLNCFFPNIWLRMIALMVKSG